MKHTVTALLSNPTQVLQGYDNQEHLAIH